MGVAEHVDVLVVGAGLSGIGAACHLRREQPGLSVAVLEARQAIGGTWDLFCYPGVRSDSDMFTLAYDFRPWRSDQAIADGPAILSYIRDTAAAYGVDQLLRFDHRVERAEWDSATAHWAVTARRGHGESVLLTCGFLFVCAGYYRYDTGYQAELPGLADFTGQVVHPQFWPSALDVTDQQVVVVGSGATAVTLVPALAQRAAHVTMLQRSPTYIAAVPSHDHFATWLRRRLPDRLALPLVRTKNILTAMATYQFSRGHPALMRRLLRDLARAQLPPGFDIDTHLAPTYNPWDQRLCATADGDLFKALHGGRAEIVTDRIERFTADGMQLVSGRELAADMVITATGLALLVAGGITVVVDGREVALHQTVTYKGMMFSGVPNFALTIGYTNASWTLKADLVAHYIMRLLRYLRRHGYTSVTPVRPELPAADLTPLIDLQAGYVLRAVDQMPRQGPATPWRLHQNYLRDRWLLRHGRLTDGVRFARVEQPVSDLEREDQDETVRVS